MITDTLAISHRKKQYLVNHSKQEIQMALEQLIGQVLDDKYRLEEKLGQGGMGAVYLATHLGTERSVALKIISPQFMRHPEFVERFKREAKAAGRLRHPNVVNVTDFGFAQIEKDRIAYLVMEYLDGCTLSEVLSEEGKLPLKFTVDILEQVCAAIDMAHQEGIIHRDLKPDNIWLQPDGFGGYNVKVLDFGLAKLGETPPPRQNGEAIFESEEVCFIQKIFNKSVSCDDTQQQQLPTTPMTPVAIVSSSATAVTIAKSSLEFTESATQAQLSLSAQSSITDETETQVQPSLAEDEAKTQVQVKRNTANIKENLALVTHVGTVLGTPIYMSPEQCKGEKLDARSDIYSLGVIAYQMLTGKTPFSGDTQSLITQHTQNNPQHIKDLQQDLPKAVSTLIMSALAKNPAERPATAAAFSNALRARSEGALTLLRQAISLYNNHFPTFIKVSLIGYAPVILFSILAVINHKVLHHIAPTPLTAVNDLLLGLLIGIGSIFAEIVIHGGLIPVVAQLLITPLHPVKIKPILVSLKSKLVPLFTTKMLSDLFASLWSILFVIPGIKAVIDYSLFKPVIIMEGLKNKEALMRSKALVKRLPWVTIKILAIKVFLLASLIINLFSTTEYKFVLSKSFTGINVKSAYSSPSIFSLVVMVVVTPLISITLALLYFKLRQAGGETLKEALGQFGEQTPRSKWQMRMRERSRLYNRFTSR